jgi:FkbM family methyltransferase
VTTHQPYDEQQSPDISAAPIVSTVAGRYGSVRFFAGDDPIGASLAMYGEWAQVEIDLMLRFVRPGDTVLDIGANVGTHTLAFARQVGSTGSVLAFEPQREVYDLLTANVQDADFANVRCYRQAVGEKAGHLIVPPVDYSAHVNTGLVSMVQPGDDSAGEETEMVSIDGLDLKACALAKIDVEGMEQEVLKGMAKTVDSFRPVVLVECNTIDSGVKSLLVRDWAGYDVFFARSSAFNPSNYLGLSTDRFGVAQETNILFVPRALKHLVPESSGEMTLIPIRDFDTLATALLETPRFGDRTRFDRVALHRLVELLPEADEWPLLADASQDIRVRLEVTERALIAAQADRDIVQAELDTVSADRDSVLASTSWRLTAPLRAAKRFFRRIESPVGIGVRAWGTKANLGGDGSPAPVTRRAEEMHHEFDYSSPEAQVALEGVSNLILEIRADLAPQVRSYERKLRLYERTFGVAVIPVLLRRAMLKLVNRVRG